MLKNLTKSQIEFTGTYSVLAELAKHGWTANLTPGTSKNTDIIAYKELHEKTIYRRIEVKTTTSSFVDKPNTTDISGQHTYWNVGNIETRNLQDIVYIFVSIQQINENKAAEHIKSQIKNISLYVDAENIIYETRFYIVPGIRVKQYLQDARIFRSSQGYKSYTYMRIGPGKDNPGSTIKDDDALSRWDILEK